MSKSIIILLLALMLAGCQSGSNSSKQPDGDPSSPKKIGGADGAGGGLFSSIFNKGPQKSIVLPPDLISSANEQVRQNHEKGTVARSQEVLPEVIGATVINEQGRRWLRVDSNAQTVWDTLADFWAAEQVDLIEYQPAAGIMETDWIETSELSEADKKRTVALLFDRIAGTGVSYDKYKIRLEKEGEDVTSVYVTHRSTERKESDYANKKVTQWEWVENDSDQEKIAQLLQVMVLLFETGGQDPA